jgi:uncharacterized protein (DUF983 family)
MGAPANASVAHAKGSDGGAVFVLTVVGSAVLAGVGIMGMVYWLVTFRWLFFLSVIPLVFGAYLFFTRATGPDHA